MLAPYSVYSLPFWASAPAPSASVTPASLGGNCLWYMTGLASDGDGANTFEYASGTNSIAYAGGSSFFSTDAPAQFGTRMGSMQALGTTLYASRAAGVTVPSGTGISVAWWVKSASAQGSPKYPFVFGNSFGSNVIAPEVHFSSGVISKLYLYYGPGGSNFNLSNITMNQWNHFCLVASPSAVPKLWVNGVAVTASNGAAPSSLAHSSSAFVANNAAGGGLSCSLTDLRVYKIALSDAQVAAIYAYNGSPASQPITV